MTTPRTLLLSPRAVADLEEIAGYLAHEAPARAASFIDALEAKCAAVAEQPEVYARRPDIGPMLRMAVHGRYLILFQDQPAQRSVRIERVLHGARDIRRMFL